MYGRHAAALLLTLWSVAAPASVIASEGPLLGGHVKSFVFERLVDPFEFERAGATLQLSLRGGSGRPASYFAAVDLRADSRLLTASTASDRGDGFEVSPVEIYLDLSGGPIEARFGQQFILWGRAAWMSPTDVLTPWDYANMASEIEDYRLAPLGARIGWYPLGELHLDFVWLPVFRPSRLGFTAPNEIGGLPVTVRPPAAPPRTPDGGEFGLRISQSISRLTLDWALLAYRGYDKLPSFDLVPVTSDGGQPVAFDWVESFDRLAMIGADLAKALGPLVFLAEAALKHDEKLDDPDASSTRLEYVAGLDWVVSESLDFGLQYVGQHRLGDEGSSDPAAALVSEPTTHAVTLRVRGAFTPNLGGQFLGVYSFTHVDAFLLAFAWWDVADAVQARAGVVAFAGADDTTPYARQRENSRAFLELKYSF